MKTKIVALLVVCLVLFSMFVSLPALAATNLIGNESTGFEGSTVAGWSGSSNTSGGWTLSTNTSVKRTGLRALKAEVTGENGATSNLTITYTASGLTVNNEYVYSAWVNIPEKIGETVATAKLRVTQGGTNAYSPGITNTTDGWEKISVQFTATQPDPQLRIVFFTDAVKGSVLYMDDVTLESKADLDAEFAAEEARKFKFVTDYGKTSNLVSDSFDDVSAWESSDATKVTFAKDENVKMNGTASMRVDVKEAVTGTFVKRLPYPSNTHGVYYELSAWFMIPEGEDSITSVGLFAEPKRLLEAPKSQYITTATISETGGKWRRLSVVYTPDSANRNGQMANLRINVNTTGAATFYVDDFKLVEKALQEPALQFLKPLNETVFVDMLTPEAGAFTVKYDIHTASEDFAGKMLVAAIYKKQNDSEQLVELGVGIFSATSSEVSIPLAGVENPDDTYSVKVMMWDSLSSLQRVKNALTYKLA